MGVAVRRNRSLTSFLVVGRIERLEKREERKMKKSEMLLVKKSDLEAIIKSLGHLEDLTNNLKHHIKEAVRDVDEEHRLASVHKFRFEKFSFLERKPE